MFSFFCITYSNICVRTALVFSPDVPCKIQDRFFLVDDTEFLDYFLLIHMPVLTYGAAPVVCMILMFAIAVRVIQIVPVVLLL